MGKKFSKKNAAKMGRKGAEARWQKRDKATDAPSTAQQPTSTADRRSRLEEAVFWVLENPLDAAPPTELRRTLQDARKEDTMTFLREAKQWFPAGKDGGDADDDHDDGEADYMKILDDMLEEMGGKTARDQKVSRLLERWEPRLVAAEDRPEEPTELWVELARIFREPLRPASGDRTALSPRPQGPPVQSPSM